MPIDDRPNLPIAETQFVNLVRAIDECEKVLKKLRRWRNAGGASDEDVERARQARDHLLTILDKGNWISEEN
jgi:hypothetical protein